MRTFLLFLLLCVGTGHIAAQPKYEIRATWLTTLGGMDWPRQKATSAAGIRRQQQELCELLDRLKEANFNTVLLQTRLRGDLIYPSTTETFAEALTGTTGRHPGYDPLAFAIDECHKRGLELHAWFVTIPAGNARQVRLLGRHSVVQQRRRICKAYNGAWYLDPGNPETTEYLSELVTDLVRRYDIDGIHFDYIRYPEQAEKFPDTDTWRRYGKGKTLQQWRRDNITAIVRRLYTDIKRLKPWVKVSSSPIGKYRDTQRYTSRGWNAYDIVYQDAQRWLKEGIHDALFPMMYFQKNNFYPFALDWKENAGGRWVVPGLGIYFLAPQEQDWPLDEVVRQIYFTRQVRLNGQAYFRNRFLADNIKGIRDELMENFYTAPALVPPLTWQDSIAPSVPSSPRMDPQPDGTIRMGWQAATDESGLPVVYHLYGADTYPVDISNPRHFIATRLTDTTYTFAPRLPWRRPHYFAVTAADRFGNESGPLALNRPDETYFPLLNQADRLCLPAAEGAKEVRIDNAWGEEVKRTAYAREISIADLPEGFYTVKVSDRSEKSVLQGSILK